MVFISVIITAHNRKEYLMQAVDSALNQTLPKTEYEVIVVKNFEDYDEELEKKGVKSIVTSEKELGEKIVIGTKEAKGEIISLLEDDDLFLPKKLEKVKKVFENKDVIFYSNECQFFRYNDIPMNIRKVNDNEKIIDMKEVKRRDEIRKLILNYGLGINNSKVSIRREIIEKHKEYIKKFTIGFDVALFLISALSGRLIIYDPEILTLYRLHDKNFSSWIRDLDKWVEKQIFDISKYLEVLDIVKKEIIEKNFDINQPYVRLLYEHVNYLISRNKMLLKVYSSNVEVSFSDLANAMKISHKSTYILLFLAGYSPKSLKK